MSRRFLCLATGGLFSLLAGCDTVVPSANSGDNAPPAVQPVSASTPAPAGGFAVLDLDEVARRLGSESEIINEMKQKESQLNEELGALQSSYARQLDEKRRALNVQPSEEQTAQLKELDRNLGTRLQQAQLDAQRELMRHQAALINRLRERVRPVARDVAKSRGLGTVVLKNMDVLFHFNTDADITDEVIEKLTAQGSVKISSEPAAAPYPSASPSSEPPSSQPYSPETYSSETPHFPANPYTASPPERTPQRR